MDRLSWLDAGGAPPELLWEDGERRFCRISRSAPDGASQPCIAVVLTAHHPTPGTVSRVAHEYELKDHLDGAWAMRPLELVRDRGQTVLMLEYHDGEPLDRLIAAPMEIGRFLRLATALAGAVARVHERGLVHKDIKPANILVDIARDRIWLMGFGIASRLLRERQSPEPPELIAGTLAYMAPEQTGRMNRSIDPRSDLYSLGVVLYQMVTGSLPFSASDPMEWVHCHIARKPAPPRERLGDIPAPVSAIIMKLLAKTPEERYQTAAGAEHDLRRCLADWESRGSIDAFSLGEHDQPDRLVIPEKLYGRAREIETLLSSFNEVVETGTPALVLVAGYSGIGKSSVVNELHKVLVPPRGLFASGKFDQYKADIPYATFAQAFQSLTRPLLSKPEAELTKWREALSEALSPNGSLMLDLVPELTLILGEQAPVVDLPAQDAQRRFQLVVRRFIGVFARPEHPLALFLDDLQWLDAATLDLLGDLLTAGDVRHLLLVGAYRDNEVSALHPLARKLDALRQTGAIVRTVTLPSLPQEDLQQLIADALHATPDRVRPLAELVESKTGGNPFFAIQFLNSLADEGLLAFDHGAAQWSWDQERTLAKGYTDNVVDLMVRKLARLPTATQRTLQQLACLGNAGDFATLCIVCERSAEAVDADLWEALRQGLILRTESAYRFAHDRVQEAAYSLIPEESRAHLHLHIGRWLVAHTPADRRRDAVFEIVNQLNRGAALITAPQELELLAELNLLASTRSKASAAYASALDYLNTGAALLSEGSWERAHELAFSLELGRAECEFLTGDLAAAEERLTALWTRALDATERAAVTCLRIDVRVNLGQSTEAIAAGLDYLCQLGVEWSAHPTAEKVRREYELVWATLGDRTIEELIDHARMSNSTYLGMVDVLIALTTPAWLTDRNLLCLVTCRAVNVSLAYGNCDASCAAYVHLGVLAGPHFGDYEAGYRFSLLANQLVDQRGLRRFQTLTYLLFGHLALPWTRHVRVGRELIRRAYENANIVGDFTYAAVSAERLNMNMLAAGDPLEDTEQQIEASLDFKERRPFVVIILSIIPQLGLVRSLRGLTRTFGTFDDGQIDERHIEDQLASNPIFAIGEFNYWVRKLQARFFAGDLAAALEAASRAQRLLSMAPPAIEVAEYHFFGALSLAASCDSADSDERLSHREALAAHQRQLAIWADQCPENFENWATLVAAEIARLEERDLDAMRLYDRAIRSAQANDFVHYEALANELAGRFYTQQGFEDIARLYLRTARDAYGRWGAHGKVRQLDGLYPYLREVQSVSPASTMATPIDHLDLATVIRVSQTVSSEIVLEKLIDALMRAAIEHAGAQRGLLILARGDAYRIEAEATTSSDGVIVTLRQADVGAADLPESVFHYVVRTRESVLLHNASGDNQFATDDYIRRRHSRSVLCLPLINRARLLGVLHLENDLSTDVFNPARISVLKLLASEAAISLQNSRLYRDLQEREARVRRLVDSNIIGIVIWHADGRVIDTNEAFLRIIGYGREDLVSGRVRWTDLTPPEWQEREARALAEMKAVGAAQAHEREYIKKDGTRVPVLVGGAIFDGALDEGVAFVLDLTERKRAEEALRESERESRLIVDTIPGLVAVLTPAGEVDVVNNQLVEYCGQPLEEMRRWGTNGTVHSEDLPRVIQLFTQAITSGVAYDFEARIRRFDGVYRWFQIRGLPLRDTSGHLARWYVVLSDIDDRRRAEDAVRASERNLKLIIDTIPALAWSARPDGSAEFFNQHYLDFIGLSAEQAREWGWTVAVHPEDMNGVAATWQRIMASEAPGEAEARLRRHDGEYRWFLFRANPLRDEEGNIVKWYGINTDIEDRKRAEVELRRAYDSFTDAQRLSKTGSFITDLVGDDHNWSQEAYRIFEFDPGTKVTLQRVRDIIHPDDLPSFDSVIARGMSGANVNFAFRIVTSRGAVKHVRGVAHVIEQLQGRPMFVGALQDVTESMVAEEALNRARSELAHVARVTTLSTLTASIAHEVNQPLSGIITNANTCLRMLAADSPDVDGARETARRTIRDGNRASEVIARLRALFSRKEFTLEPLDLNEATREVIALSSSDLQRNRVVLQSELADDLPTISGDRIQLQQVILNLLRNASDAMVGVHDRPRQLLIRTEREDDDRLRVTVQDTGVGFDRQSTDKLFDAFYTTKSDGMGIGLSVSRSIVERHHGRLWAEPNDGPGATFAFSIPRGPESVADAAPVMRKS